VFCPNCGIQLSDSALFCSRCGSSTQAPARATPPASPVYGSTVPVGGSFNVPPVVVPPPQNPVQRLRTQVHVLGILWAIYSAFRLMFWVAGLPFRSGVMAMSIYSGRYGSAGYPFMHFWSGAFLFSRVLSLATGVVGIWAAVSLMRRHPEGRTIAIVAACLALFSFPLGTALGIYTLVLLLRQGSREAYEALSTAR
jgi:hypothetical protein